jgi:tetratricopeptide (TPR) repeat protein
LTHDALIERDREREQLARWVGEAVSGAGRMVLIAGEAGVGKTSLVDAFCRSDARLRRVRWGACDAMLTPRPLGPLFDLASDFGDEIPALLQADSSREQLLSAVLEELGRARPTALVIEDVHWADEGTLDLIRFLARRIERTGAIVFVTYRADEVSTAAPLQQVIGDIASFAPVRRVHLDPLSPTGVAEIAGTTDPEARRLFELTRGNPFYVTEVIAGSGHGVPATVRDAVLARTSRLSTAARECLAAAAIFPGRVEEWLLEATYEGPSAGLDECISRRLLERESEALRFRHELARVAVEGAIASRTAKKLHARALDAMREHPATAADHARLAHHAEAAGDLAAVLVHAPAAARTAARLRGHVEAAAQWARALRAAGSLAPEQRAAMYEARSRECYLIDELEEALSARERAHELWRELDDAEHIGDSLIWLSELAWQRGDRTLNDRYLAEAIAILEQLPAGHALARAYAHRSGALMTPAKIPRD